MKKSLFILPLISLFLFACDDGVNENPPITEEMLKGLMMQMGRKPNQKQINQMMKAMQKYQ